MFCANCGKENAADMRFCQACGTPIPETTNTYAPQEGSPAPSNTYIPPQAPPMTYGTYQAPPSATQGAYTDSHNTYDAPYVSPYSVQPQQNTQGKGLAVTGLILSIVGAVFSISCCLSYVGIPLCIASIIMGAISLKNPNYRAMGIAALVIGIVGAALGVALIVLASTAELSYDWYSDFFDDYSYYY